MMHIFIAGVMQGARRDEYICEQDYRLAIAECLSTYLPEARITDPWALNPNSVEYDEPLARETFRSMTYEAGEADLLIAFLPRLSMGTAMEMWEAHRSNTYVIAVTPYVHQWAIRFTADEIVPDLESLLELIKSGHVRNVLNGRAAVDAPPQAE
jgi:NAD-dependent SIR2 family protein deacetylase